MYLTAEEKRMICQIERIEQATRPDPNAKVEQELEFTSTIAYLKRKAA